LKNLFSRRSIDPTDPEIIERLRIEAAYSDRNAERTRSPPEFRHQLLFVGSAVIKARCKTVIGSGFKLSGMFWQSAANAIVALPDPAISTA
jgi:hypothetical protein